MNKTIHTAGVLLAALSFPFVAFAQAPDVSYFANTITAIQGLINLLLPLLIGIAVVVFIWGVIRYITAGEDPERRKAGRSLMIYGIIGLFVIVAVWGLVQILVQLTGTGGIETTPLRPQLPT